MFGFELENVLRLVLGLLPFILCLKLYFLDDKRELGLICLLVSAFILRMLFATWDPYLHNWDERYHALVAKNMMSDPFKPMLRLDPIFPYKFKAWCCNHVWLHKQPLFMWQMALSMKMFGANEFAVRLPSVLMGTIQVYFIFSIVKIWLKDNAIAFKAAFFSSLVYLPLEMVAGRHALDHNDLSFLFYLTAGIWALCKYMESERKLFAFLIALFIAAAVLIKWLTALLVFGGWGLYLLQSKFAFKNYLSLLVCMLLSGALFLPWQLYLSLIHI